ncbi:MAG: hypothetical protein MJA30_37185 [Cytophagales bacterium]|nr:hypothetical protein [Cytophagales bacterium]
MTSVITISSYLFILPLGITFLRRNSLDDTQKLLRWVIYLLSASQMIGTALWYFKINNLPLIHIYPLIELAIFSVLYQKALRTLYHPNVIPFLTGLVIVFSIFNSVFVQSIFVFSSNSITLVSGVLIIYSISYFVKLLRDPPIDFLDRSPMFWINCAILIYFSGSFMIFMYSNYMLPKSKDTQMVMWGIHAILNMARFFLFSIALWVKEKR